MPVFRARGLFLVSALAASLGLSSLALAGPLGHGPRVAKASAPRTPDGACGPENFTQNASTTPEAQTSIACIIQDGSFRHFDTSWWRAFRLQDYGLEGDFGICAIDMAIETAVSGDGNGQPMTVNLWLNSEDCPFPGGTRELLGTATINVTDQDLTNITVPVFGTVPALREVAVEIAIPDGVEANDVFFAGSNTAAQTAPTYISSQACSLPDPIDLAAIGFPDSHVIITLVGVSGPVGPVGIVVDGPGNSVIELGEPVAIEPSYKNLTSGDLAVLGSKVGIFVPPPFTSGILDGTADYGTIPAGQTHSCTETANCYSVQFDGTGFGHRDGIVDESLTFVVGPQSPAGGSIPRSRILHIGGSFADVPTANIFYRHIETLLHYGVTGGCATQDSYCPGDITLRKQMAVFLLKALLFACYVPPAATGVFTDVPSDDPFAPWIEDLAARGITGGCGTDIYCPNDPVKRKQMAVFLLKTLEGSGYTPPAAVGIFDDVPAADTFAPWIEDLYNRGITGGCSGGPPPAPIFFCPENSVTRGQMAAFLTLTFNLLLYRP
jgi:hypothetical protein